MYEKNLTEDLRLRLCKSDMDFLRKLAAQRSVSISEVIRSIIGEYRRSLDMIDAVNALLKLNKEGGELSSGDTEADINDKL